MSTEESLKSKVEALLFASPAPLKISEVARLLESSNTAVKRALDDLIAELAVRDGALSVAKQGSAGYAIVLKMDYQDVASLLMPPELEPAVVKTLSVIAVNQPLAQSRLVELRGSSAYDHVKSLVEKGFVRRRKDGQTYILRTTKTFATRFRVEDDPERIREAMTTLEESRHGRGNDGDRPAPQTADPYEEGPAGDPDPQHADAESLEPSRAPARQDAEPQIRPTAGLVETPVEDAAPQLDADSDSSADHL